MYHGGFFLTDAVQTSGLVADAAQVAMNDGGGGLIVDKCLNAGFADANDALRSGCNANGSNIADWQWATKLLPALGSDPRWLKLKSSSRGGRAAALTAIAARCERVFTFNLTAQCKKPFCAHDGTPDWDCSATC